MGTRADFYVDKEWLGSIAWDGYPGGIPGEVLGAQSEQAFKDAVAEMLEGRDDGTTPDMGWPWPWESGRLTDYSYVYSEGRGVLVSSFGSKPVELSAAIEIGKGHGDWPAKIEFPDMRATQNVTLGKRSGVLVLRAPD